MGAQKVTDRSQLSCVDTLRILHRQEKGGVTPLGKENGIGGDREGILSQNVRIGAEAETDRHAFGQRFTGEVFPGNAEDLNEQIYVLYPDNAGRVDIVAEIAVILGGPRLNEVHILEGRRIALEMLHMQAQQPRLFSKLFDLLIKAAHGRAIAVQQLVSGGSGVSGSNRV